MSTPTLVFQTDWEPLVVDLPTLYETRLLIQASSGAGKTHSLFDLLQQTYGAVQHLVIDKEGEFARLRQKYDYLLVGTDGELALDMRKGAIELLLRKVLELQVNAIWDLSDLPPDQMKQYVARLAREAAHLPQRSGLWDQMRLMVIDEIPFFAPQGGKAEREPALEPLIELVSLSRKRGFCPVGATTRVERLDKNVSELLENRLIGRAGASSSKRAAELLDFDTKGRRDLITLAKGHFWAYGPALALDPVLVHTRSEMAVVPRKRGEIAPPAPTPTGLKKVVSALEGFQHEAEQEAHTIDELRGVNAQLKRRVKELERAKPVVPVAQHPSTAAVQKQIDAALDAERKTNARVQNERYREQLTVEKQLRAQIKDLSTRIYRIGNFLRSALEVVDAPLQEIAASVKWNGNGHPHDVARNTPVAEKQREIRNTPVARRPVHAAVSGASMLPKGEHAILTAACQYPDGVTRQQLTILTAYKRSSRDAYIQRLREKGLVQLRGDLVIAAEGAELHLGDFEPLPTGRELREYWANRLPAGEQAFFLALVDAHPDGLTRDQLSEITEYKRSSRDAYLQRMSAKKIIEITGGSVRAADFLFDN